MKVRHLSLICILLFSSCANRVYTPALFGNNIAYQPKPMTYDTKKTANYISGTFGAHAAVNTDNVSFGELNFSRAHAFKNGNLAIGAFGFAGRVTNGFYTNDTASNSRFRHISFEGLGIRASGNLNTSFGRTDWRFLGFEAAYSKEFGAYSNFRKSVFGLPGYSTSLSSSLFNAGLTTEIIWHGKSNIENQYGFRFYIGRNFGNLRYLDSLTIGSSSTYFLNSSSCFFMQLHHITGSVQVAGFLSIQPAIRLAVGYRF